MLPFNEFAPDVAKRLFDILLAFFALILLLPLMVVLAAWIALDSRGGVFFLQERIGRNGIPFQLVKFRTMRPDSEREGQITVGAHDRRISRAGRFLRRYKLDELPQLLNILAGDMSVVGPRPEVPKYVAMYTDDQRRVLDVRPGLTDYASLEYFRENELLAAAEQPEQTYISEIMPAKLALNQRYIREAGLWTDLKIIGRTIRAIVKA